MCTENHTRMKNVLILLLIAAVWVCVGIIFSSPQAEHVGGFPHPEYSRADKSGKPTMLQGGDGATRHQSILWVSWARGTLLVIAISALLVWSLAKGRSARSEATDPRTENPVVFWSLMGICSFVYVFCFSMVFFEYHASLDNPYNPVFLGPFPAAETWYFFTWAAPCLFVVVYMVFFHRWVSPPESLERFEKLLTSKDRSESRDETS